MGERIAEGRIGDEGAWQDQVARKEAVDWWDTEHFLAAPVSWTQDRFNGKKP
jgi:hypothetical protein